MNFWLFSRDFLRFFGRYDPKYHIRVFNFVTKFFRYPHLSIAGFFLKFEKCKNNDIEILGFRFLGIFDWDWSWYQYVTYIICQKYLIGNRIEIYIFRRIFCYKL